MQNWLQLAPGRHLDHFQITYVRPSNGPSPTEAPQVEEPDESKTGMPVCVKDLGLKGIVGKACYLHCSAHSASVVDVFCPELSNIPPHLMSILLSFNTELLKLITPVCTSVANRA